MTTIESTSQVRWINLGRRSRSAKTSPPLGRSRRATGAELWSPDSHDLRARSSSAVDHDLAVMAATAPIPELNRTGWGP